MNHLTRAKSVFEMEIEELRGVLSRLDDNFNQAVELMSQALDRGNKIVIVGVGKSGNIGAKIVATLNSTGTPTVLLDSLNALHGDLGIVQDGDVCIAMSFSGETSELLALLPFIKRFELPIISMTGNTASSLAKYSDIVLDTGVSREACPLNLAPTSSTTAMLVMGDALAMALAEAGWSPMEVRSWENFQRKVADHRPFVLKRFNYDLKRTKDNEPPFRWENKK